MMNNLFDRGILIMRRVGQRYLMFKLNCDNNYIFVCEMALKNFFNTIPTQLSFWKKPIMIETKRLSSVKADLYENLKAASCSYIEGLVDLDQEFLEKTTSPYLFKIIKNELLQSQTSSKQFVKKIKKQHNESLLDTLKSLPFSIAPYVVFGEQINTRINNHPYEGLQLTRNRYFAIDQNKPPVELLKNIFYYQTYGFRCYLFTQNYVGMNLTVTFEGNLFDQDYFVVDINHHLLGRGAQKAKGN